MVYFDNAATSFPKPDVVYEMVMKSMKEYGANPGRSGHKLALKLGREILETRETIANLFNIENSMNVIFTFNCTEGLNLAIKGALNKGDHVITTSMEHNSVVRPLKALEKEGIEVTFVQGDSAGIINPTHIEKNIKKNTKLIITTHVSNLTGTIMPIETIGQIAKRNGLYYLVDAAQSAGVYDIDVQKMNIDMLAFPGHKSLFGPQGTGGLYIREGLNIKEMEQGGTGSISHMLEQPDIRPDRYESGTPNGPGIVGLGAGVRHILEEGIDNIRAYQEELTEHFIEEILKIDKVKAYGPLDIKHQGAVVPINIGDMDSSELSYILDQEYDIEVRPGLHCTPLAHKTIGTFEQGAVRFSFSFYNTHDEIEYGIKAIKEISRDM